MSKQQLKADVIQDRNRAYVAHSIRFLFSYCIKSLFLILLYFSSGP